MADGTSSSQLGNEWQKQTEDKQTWQPDQQAEQQSHQPL
jgi:hypothetical protein